MAAIRFKRGTRAQLDAAAAAGQLALGEPYVITDEDAMAFGLGTSSYMDVEGAMRTWASGMTVRKHQKVVSPADNEEYRRITATGGGTTDPADDLTNYRAVSYERTDAILGAAMLTAAATGITNFCFGATKSIFGALGVGARTSVLSVTGRGCLDYLVLSKGAAGTTRIEVIVDGHTKLDRTDTHSSSTYLLALGMPSANGGSNSFVEARFDPAGVQFRRSLQIYVTNVTTDSAAAAGIAYHLRSVA